jgi:predicted nuclease of restriction endonuclease-like (RecB) superfamily
MHGHNETHQYTTNKNGAISMTQHIKPTHHAKSNSLPHSDSDEVTRIRLAPDYKLLLDTLKNKILNARVKAALAVNQEVIQLYWHIGQDIIEKQKMTKWGDKLIEMLSHDLQHAFPETRGFSPASLKRMRMFYEYYPNIQFGSQPVTQLPWGHIQLLIFKIKEEKTREWYAEQCVENGWSRITLEKHIKNNLFHAKGI